MSAANIAPMARQLGMQSRFLAQQAREKAEGNPCALSRAAAEAGPALSPPAPTLAGRLQRVVESTTKKLAARLPA
jgi:serine/threonine-protein kinase HipA